MKKIWSITFLSIMVSFVFSLPISAKESVTRENFDYEWYLEKHPELTAIVDGNDKAAVWNFYQTTGKAAGWNGRVAREALLTESDFDAIRYAKENPDLMEAFGLDKELLYQHYKAAGFMEGRKGYALSEETNAKLAAYELADTITAAADSDAQKVREIHDWMVKNMAYDYENYVSGTIPERSYGLEGAVLYGKAVCQGYAEAFSYFMYVLGIESEMVTGTANNGNGLWIGHAWNKVKIDGNWYYVDVTWDDPVPDRGDCVYWYQYYLVADPTFGGDHRPKH